MTVAFDAKTVWTSLTGTSLTITTLTVGSGANRALLIHLLCGSQGTTFPAGLTITRDTGEVFTQVPSTSFADGGITATGAVYALLNPTSGNKTITISWTGSNEMHACAFSFSNVDQTSVAVAFPHGATVVHGTSTASPVAVTVTSATGNLVSASFLQNVSAWGAISGLANSQDSATGPNLAVAANYDNGAASVSLTAVFTGPAAWAAIGCDVLAAAGGGAALVSGVLGIGIPKLPLVKPPMPIVQGVIQLPIPVPVAQVLGLPRLPLVKPPLPIIQGVIPPPPPSGTPTLVQLVGSTQNDNNGISGNGFVFNAPNPTLLGNCLVLAISYPYSATRTILISDSNGDIWPSPFTTGTASSGNRNVSIYVLPNATAGLHKLTVTFDASLKGFQYTLAEFYNVSTVSPLDGTQGANSVTGSSANAGLFTPTTNNDASGGHLIFSYAASNDNIGTNVANEASAISATNSASLLHADNSCTMPSASAYSVQATNGSINPGFSFTQSTPTNFVVAAIALKAALAGNAPAAGIRIIRLLHCTCPVPQTGNNVFLFPSDGNLLIATMAAGSNLNQVNSVTDSNSQTYASRGSAGNSQIFDKVSATPSNALALTLNLNAAEPQFSIHLFDITGADPSPFLNASGFNGAAPGSGTVCNDLPDHTPTAAPGLTIAATGFGTGPTTSLAAGAPAGAVYDLVFYTGMTDQDRMDNADGFGHINYTTTAAQTWNWTITSASWGSTAFATAVSYKAAAAGNAVVSNSGGLLEFIASICSDGMPPGEFASALQRDGIPTAEIIAALRRDGVPTFEIINGLRADWPANADLLALLRSDALAPLEVLGSLRDDTVTLSEVMDGLCSDIIVSVEAIARAQSDSATNAETTASFRGDAVGQDEIVGGVRADVTAPAEIIAKTQRDAAVPEENLGALAVTGDAPLQLETTAKFSADAKTQTESSAAVLASSGSAAELLVKITSDRAVLGEVLVALSASPISEVEITVGVQASAEEPLDTSVRVTVDRVALIEILTAVRRDQSAPIEIVSLATGVTGNSAFALEIIDGLSLGSPVALEIRGNRFMLGRLIDRIVIVGAEDRIVIVGAEDRIVTVEDQDLTIIVKQI
jgi:hypothetical protein